MHLPLTMVQSAAPGIRRGVGPPHLRQELQLQKPPVVQQLQPAPAHVAATIRQPLHSHRQLVQARARPQVEATGLLSSPLVQPFVGLVGTRVFLAMEVAVLLAVLALTDAAYSGDWSRIGVIPADLEPPLQRLTLLVWGLHGVCGVVAASIAKGRGRSWGSAALKGLLFGSMHVFEEAVLAAEVGPAPQPNPTAGGRQR